MVSSLPSRLVVFCSRSKPLEGEELRKFYIGREKMLRKGGFVPRGRPRRVGSTSTLSSYSIADLPEGQYFIARIIDDEKLLNSELHIIASSDLSEDSSQISNIVGLPYKRFGYSTNP